MTLPQSKTTSTRSEDVLIPTPTRRLVQDHKSSARWLQIILDASLVAGLLYLHVLLKDIPFETEYRALAIMTVLLMAVIYNINGVYKFSTSLFDRFLNYAKAWAVVLAFIVLVGFVTKTSNFFSREVILTWSVTGFLAQLLAYMAISQIQANSKQEEIPTLVVGSDRLAQHLADHINANPWIPDHVLGLVAEDGASTSLKCKAPLLGELNRLHYLVEEHGIRRVYIALPMQRAEWVKPIYMELVESNIDIIWAPDIFSVNLLNHSVRELGGVPLISLSETPLIGSNAFVKTVMDYSIASMALIALSPVMLLTALLIKLTSNGPIFFTQKRHGWDGEIITIYKFRSMRLHEEEPGVVTQATKEDDRVTAVGKFIRKTSIDELPQLFNVLNGSMSIVGPRPHAIAHNQFYGEKIKDYMTRHRVKPGITGLAQVNGYRGETQNIESMEGRVQYDLAYINNWSLWLDIKIMIKTVFVLFGKNAY